MRVLLVSSGHRAGSGKDLAVDRLAAVLGREHEVTVIDPYLDEEPSGVPPIAFSCEDHKRSAALLAAIEEAYGKEPPDYAEFADYRGAALVPLQARAAGHRSLRGTAMALRLRGAAEPIALHDGSWPRPAERMVFDLEREALRLADRVVHPSEEALASYREALGGVDLGAATRIRVPFEPGPEPEPRQRASGGPLRILCVGRLERVKGVLTLLEACLSLASADWRLTLIGGDTTTAPMAQSVRATLEVLAAGDERVEILDPFPYEELQRRYGEHDLLAVPSFFECWSDAALEAMRAGLPVLASPVGGLREIVVDGVSGWHTEGSGREPIRRALERLLADRGEVERVHASGAPRARFLELTGEDEVLASYRDLFADLSPARPQKPSSKDGFRGLGASSEPLVTGVVTYYGEHEEVREAVDSLRAQTHRNLEVIVVDDGSFRAEDGVLAELAELDRVRVAYKPNGGESTARNLGALLADGEYVVFLDADNTLEPGFVARAVAMIEVDPKIAYVTSWLRFFGEPKALAEAGTGGYAPLGNAVRSDDAINSDGDSIALMPRRLFTHEGYAYEEEGVLMADWEFYRRLREDGRFGVVIPALEANYRVRPGSLSSVGVGDLHALSWDEALSRRQRRMLAGAGS
ncbi:MAG TPA: glycosyltransferase [Solirubrobacterales bacterium]|jgi:glycosyltransferase involved in cell wall biosynthesis|nr:glycosyltransferase [Solirubrobacterales bacterium]